MDKVVAAYSQTVTVAGHLPDAQFRMAGLDARSHCAAATVNGIEPVRVQVMRHTTGATYTRDYRYLMRRYTYLCHCFLQRGADSVVTATRAETYVLIGFIILCCHNLQITNC